MLVIPGEQMLDLMVRIGIALRETADCGGSLPPQGSRKLKLAADPLCPAITIGQGPRGGDGGLAPILGLRRGGEIREKAADFPLVRGMP